MQSRIINITYVINDNTLTYPKFNHETYSNIFFFFFKFPIKQKKYNFVAYYVLYEELGKVSNSAEV